MTITLNSIQPTLHELKQGLKELYGDRLAHMILNHSFYELFCELTKDEAFDVVIRAKRGFIDTSKHGCHVKDKVYFEGFHQVSTHLEKHPDDYPLLMSGKVAISMLPAVRELHKIGDLLEPKYLPQQLIINV